MHFCCSHLTNYFSVIMVSAPWSCDFHGKQALEEEVLGRGKILYQAMSLGQSLRTVGCVDDKELVQAKLNYIHSRYIELQEHCRQKAELLRQALANAQLFGEDEVALMTWLDEVHGKLSEVSIQDYTTAVLAKQHAEQLVLYKLLLLRLPSPVLFISFLSSVMWYDFCITLSEDACDSCMSQCPGSS